MESKFGLHPTVNSAAHMAKRVRLRPSNARSSLTLCSHHLPTAGSARAARQHNLLLARGREGCACERAGARPAWRMPRDIGL